MRISDWSSDVCSSDLDGVLGDALRGAARRDGQRDLPVAQRRGRHRVVVAHTLVQHEAQLRGSLDVPGLQPLGADHDDLGLGQLGAQLRLVVTLEIEDLISFGPRSEEHTSELQSLMRISYAVFCLKKNNT